MIKQKTTVTPKPNLEIEKLESRIAELETLWKRALADYQNLEKRVADQKSMYIKLANMSLIQNLIDVEDDLERASNHLKDKGLEMIVSRLKVVLKDEGLEEIVVENQNFDPSTMECVEVVEGQKDVVMKVAQKGYRLYDTVLRPVKVEVGSGIFKAEL